MEVIIRQKDISCKYYRVLLKASRMYYKKDKRIFLLLIFDMLFYVAFLGLFEFLSSYLDEWKWFLYDYYQNRIVYYIYPIILFSVAFFMLYFGVVRQLISYKIMIKSSFITNFGDYDCKICLKEDGIYDFSAGDDAYHFFAYSTIRNIDNINQHLVIVIGKALIIAIPYVSFKDETQRIEFEDFLKKKISVHDD